MKETLRILTPRSQFGGQMSQALQLDAWDALPPRPSTPQVRGETPKPTGQLGADPETHPLEEIDPADPELFAANQHLGFFARLRRDDPVHLTRNSYYGGLLVGHTIR